MMADSSVSYRGCHFPGPVIAYAVWLCLRFPLSYRDVEELLAERGIRVSYETIRRWVARFAPHYAAELRKRRDPKAAESFFRTLLGRSGGEPPERITADKLGSYAAALQRLPELEGVEHLQVRSALRCNNRVEQAHQPTRIRERRMGRFRCAVSAQCFLAAFTRTSNLFRSRRRSFTAPEYRTALQERFAAWQLAAGLRA